MSDTGWELASLSALAIWERLAAELTAAAGSGRHPFHLLTVATVGAGGFPAVRTVVLRGFDPDRRDIRFHTDIRSPKAAQLAGDGRLALHWYDAESRLQIRIAAQATVHHQDATARDAWLASRPSSRGCYGSAAAPGTPVLDIPAPPKPLAADDATGLANFAVVCCRFAAVELLALHASGHERILLEFDGLKPTRTILAP